MERPTMKKRLVKLLEIRWIVYWFQSGKVKQKTFSDKNSPTAEADARRFELQKHMAWQAQEKIYSNGFERINVGVPF